VGGTADDVFRQSYRPTSVAGEIVEREHGKRGRSSLIRRDCCSQAVIPRAAEAAAVAARTARIAGPVQRCRASSRRFRF
jgi:hypothetical protein